MLVIDASLALYLASRRDGFKGFRRRNLVAPPLLWSETLSALHQAVWRGEVSRDLAAATLERLQTAPIHTESPPQLRREVWAVADDLGWAKTYDAEYVALARLLGCRLLTRDGRLLRGAARLVKTIGPADLR